MTVVIVWYLTEPEKDSDSEDDDSPDLPFITAFEASGQSRLTNEFEILRSIGKGGFGDVIEVSIREKITKAFSQTCIK